MSFLVQVYDLIISGSSVLDKNFPISGGRSCTENNKS
jgi:hypothetical protein